MKSWDAPLSTNERTFQNLRQWKQANSSVEHFQHLKVTRMRSIQPASSSCIGCPTPVRSLLTKVTTNPLLRKHVLCPFPSSNLHSLPLSCLIFCFLAVPECAAGAVSNVASSSLTSSVVGSTTTTGKIHRRLRRHRTWFASSTRVCTGQPDSAAWTRGPRRLRRPPVRDVRWSWRPTPSTSVRWIWPGCARSRSGRWSWSSHPNRTRSRPSDPSGTLSPNRLRRWSSRTFTTLWSSRGLLMMVSTSVSIVSVVPPKM